MADENILQIGARVDLSGLQAGMSQAASTVQAATNQMAQGFAAANAASASSASVMAQQLLSQGLAIADVNSALRNLGFTASQVKDAMATLGVQSTVTAAAAREVANSTTAIRGGVGPIRAATVEIEALRGGLMGSSRAAAAFLTTTLGLGTALQAAFPIFGALAFEQVIGQVYDRFVSLVEELGGYTDAVKKAEEENIKFNEQALTHAANLEINQRLLNETLRHQNELLSEGWVERYAEAAKKAKDETSLWLNIIPGLGGVVQGWRAITGATKDYADQLTKLDQDQQAILARGRALMEEEARLQDRLKTARLQAAMAGVEGAEQYRIKLAELGVEEEAELRKARENQAGQQQMQIIGQIYAAKRKEVEVEAANAIEKAWEKAAAALAKEGFELDKVTGKVSVGPLLKFEAGGELDKVADQVSKQQDQLLRAQMEADTKAAQEHMAVAEAQISADEQVGNARVKLAEDTYTRQYQAGLISLTDYIAALRAEADEEYNIRLSALQQQAVLYADEPAKVIQVNAEIEKLELEHEKRMADITHQAITEQSKQLDEMQKKYEDVFNRIGGTISRGLSSWITGHQTFGRAVAQVWDSLLNDAINAIFRIAEQWIIQHVLMAGANRIFHMQVMAAEVTAHAEQSTRNVATVTSDAAVAAAGAMAYWSAINPIIAPAMAAAQFGQTMAYAGPAAFEMGGIVPATGLGLLHGGEMVLPRKISESLQAMVGQGTSSPRVSGASGGNGEMHIHVSPIIHAIDSQDVERFFDQHSDRLARGLAKAVNRGHLKLSKMDR